MRCTPATVPVAAAEGEEVDDGGHMDNEAVETPTTPVGVQRLVVMVASSRRRNFSAKERFK